MKCLSQVRILKIKEEPSSLPQQEKIQEYKPRIPSLERLKQDKEDALLKKFFNIFKQLHINIPLIEALSQMPKYIKFTKDLLTNKRKLEEIEIVALTGNCLTVLQKKFPKKLADPESFIIPCVMGDGIKEKALSNSAVSINVMPYTLFLKLGIEDLGPTKMTVQLANHSVRKPRGVVEDVLVKVDKIIILVDFVILDVDNKVDVPLILGLPFLNTTGILIDVKGGK